MTIPRSVSSRKAWERRKVSHWSPSNRSIILVGREREAPRARTDHRVIALERQPAAVDRQWLSHELGSYTRRSSCWR